MAVFVHPDLESVSLAAALHALADPVRLEVVARLADFERLNCGMVVCPERDLPKSTISNHMSVLRQAGIVRTAPAGRERVNTLRREEFDRRFPGLLDAILTNRDEEAR